MHTDDTTDHRIARSIQRTQDEAALRSLNEDGGDYSAGLSRLRHAAVEMDGDTWERACERFPGDAGPRRRGEYATWGERIAEDTRIALAGELGKVS